MDLTQWWKDHQDTARPQRMWDAWQQPHRQMVEVALHCLPLVESVYEVGCGSGPNLRRLRAMFPSALRLGGSEPCESLAAWASEHLGIPIAQTALPDVPSGPWDVVLSVYTMAYCEPDTVAAVLDKLQGVAKYLVLLEPTADCPPFGAAGLYVRAPGGLPEWAHDYPDLAGPGWTTLWKWPLLPPTDGCNALTILTREVT